jgi:spore germination cell wall hydrolase CwlJ-like protein
MPELAQFRLASLTTAAPELTGAIVSDPISPNAIRPQQRSIQFPSVDRTLKGDLLARPAPEVPGSQGHDFAVAGDGDLQLEAEINATARLRSLSTPRSDDDITTGSVDTPQTGDGADAPAPQLRFHEENASVRTATLFFGSDIAPVHGALEPWAPGEAPVLVTPRAPVDSEFKLAALTPSAAQPSDPADPAESGESIAGKGQVTGEGQRPKTPAERLGLEGASRAKAEKCLASAVYFEARGEAVRGQIAVAQVVLNRVFSGYYPETVCGVVYQNAHRRLACQFTFACDGHREVVTEDEAWHRAARIARETLDGKLWLPEVDRSTHYHAYWVRPSWVRTMKTMHKLGVHTFYRPLNWGDGANAPAWGDPMAMAEAETKL